MKSSGRGVLLFVIFCAIATCGLAQSIEALKQKASAGDALSQLTLARDYDAGLGVPQNEQLAFKWYLAAAEKGNADAQSAVGLCYRLGRGVEQDKGKAIPWYLKAAAQGNANARYNLGTAYYNGDGVEINDMRSYAWFVLAVESGDSRAQEAVDRAKSEHSPAWIAAAELKLAEMFDDGTDVPANPARATDAYRKVLANKNSGLVELDEAHFRLANLYETGRGVPRDMSAVRQHLVASSTFSVKAIQQLGTLYEAGAFGSPDYKQAAHWYQLGIRSRDAFSMRSLGHLYETGRGVKQDRVMAFELYIMAFHRGLPDAQNSANLLFPQLTEKEFAKAQKDLAKEGISLKRKNN